jgi:nucleoside-diphosphate-sugar epimerase
LKKKILIVGGTGFIGQNLLKRCIESNLNVTILSSSKKKNKVKLYKQIFCDISIRKKLIKKLKNKNFDYVVNLAGYVDHSKKIKTLKTHYNGCKNLADYFKNQKLKKFIQIGSSVEYGKIKAPQIESKKIKEDSLKSYYGLAKLKSTKYLLGLNEKNAFPCTILRFFLVYGPGQSENRIIPFVIKNCLRKKTFNSSSGKQVRDFLYIDDAIESIMKCLKNKESNGQIINVCSSSPVKIKFVINKIWKIIKKGKPIFGKIRLRPDEPTKLFSNYSKANKILNWKPTINLNQGIKKTIKYYE